MKKVLVILGIAVGVLALAVGIFVAVFDLDEVINQQKDQHLPRVEAMLGRKVQIGQIQTTILPVLGAEIADVVVMGRTPDEPPLLKLDRVVVKVDLWTAIKSAGTDVQLDALLLEGLAVHLVREADGSLSYEDVLKRLSEGPPPEEAPQPLDAETRRFIEGLKLERVALVDGRFELVDKATGGAPATTHIEKLNVELNDVVLASPFEVRVRAAIFAQQENFDLTVKVGPVPIGQPDAEVPIHHVALKADGVDLAKVVPYLGPDFPVQVDSATFSADLTVEDPLAAKGRIAVAGSLGLKTVALGGEPFDLEATPNLTFDPKAGLLDLTGFGVDLSGMKVTASGKVHDLNTARPRFEGLKVATTGLDLGRLQAMLPPFAAALPKGAKLGGPLVFTVDATGDAEKQVVQARFDLDGARIFLPDALDKPAGTALHLSLDATTTPKRVDLKGLSLAVGGLNLTLAGAIAGLDATPTFDLKGDTGQFPLGGLMRLLPAVKAGVPADVQIAGNLQVGMHLKGSAKDLDAQVQIGISGADLAVPGVTVRGSGRIAASAQGDPASNLATKVDMGLDGLEVKAGPDFHKPAGTPFSVNLDATTAGANTTVRTLNVQIGPLAVKGSGSANGGVLNVNVDIPRFAVAGLTSIVPALKDGPLARATLGMKLAFKGDPGRPASVEAKMDDFYFAVGQSSLAGQLTVKNLDAPNVRFEFTSPHFELEEVVPPSDAPAAKDEGGGGPLPPIVQRIDAAGGLRIAKGKAVDIPFTDFVGTLTMQNGVVRFSKLQFRAYDGTFSAAPTEVNLSGPEPAFDLNVKMEKVDANALLTDQADMPNTLTGRMNTDFQLKGRGDVWEKLAPTLTGALGLALENGKLASLNLEGDILGAIADKVPGLKANSAGGTALRDLAARFTVQNGKLTLKQPITTQTGSGPLELDGAIGLDSSLHLTGTLTLSPDTIRRLSGGRAKVDAPVPVSVRIGGTLTDPKVSGVEGEKLALLLAAGAVGMLAGEQIEDAKKAAEAAKARALAEAKKAEAQARAAAARAEREARMAAGRAKAEAEKAKKEAEAKARAAAEKAKKEAKDKAAKEAKKQLKGLF
ncbi:MAG: DUF748 domain-containing protein [Myxococcales bacterium]|nr:DUF748 domain-containing protein [Myxococcales bacterium]